MKFLAILASTLLPLSTMATPLIAERSVGPKPPSRGGAGACPSLAAREPMAEAEAVGLIEKRNVNCDIVGVGTDLYVGCWFDPHNGGSGNILEDTIAGSRNDVTFSCYTTCGSIGGNTHWDWAVNHGCYVPAYYTDSGCTTTTLPACGWNDC